jgi:hypothetical protein
MKKFFLGFFIFTHFGKLWFGAPHKQNLFLFLSYFVENSILRRVCDKSSIFRKNVVLTFAADFPQPLHKSFFLLKVKIGIFTANKVNYATRP